MSLWTPTIRLRLTLWYAGVVLLILAVVSVGIYGFMRNRLHSLVRNKLDMDYATIESVLINSMADMNDIAHLDDAIAFELSRRGDIAYRSDMWDEAGFSVEFDGLGSDEYGTWLSAEGHLYHVRSDTSAYAYVLTVAQDASDAEANLRTLAMILLGGIPLVFVLAVAGGYFLAGRVLAPVKEITAKAREISADNLSDRLPVTHPGDEIGGLATVFNDTLARLEASFERLRRFTADASHELRTPLTSIRSVGEVAMQGPIDEESSRDAIGSMLEETERLAGLIDNLLILARGDSGGLELAPERLDLAVLVAEIASELRVLAEEKNQTLLVEPDESVFVTVDAATIRQALTNVIHNAIRYTPQGGRVDVRVGRTDYGGAVIDIIDDGPGIPAGERERVFDRFYRLDRSRTKIVGGAGLGLSIARWAVEANGGKIEFVDKTGSGAHCRITLLTSRI